jgi:hypothetical protein
VAQLSVVALDQAPCTMPLVLAAELVTPGRPVAPPGAIAHRCQLRSTEQPDLTHAQILS